MVDQEYWDNFIFGTIIVYWVLFIIEFRNEPYDMKLAIQIMQTLLVVIFTVDITLRIIGRGLKFEFNTAFFGMPISALEIIFLIGTQSKGIIDCLFCVCVFVF